MSHREVPISEAPTRFLMKERSFAYCSCGPDHNCYGSLFSDRFFRKFGSDHDGTSVGIVASQGEIREELAKREHVPSKEEGKVSRRKKQQHRHGLAKSKDR